MTETPSQKPDTDEPDADEPQPGEGEPVFEDDEGEVYTDEDP